MEIVEGQSDITRGLNKHQRTAVTTPASVVQILAPPGSGKTRTLTARVAHLLSEPLCLAPQDIIVATFTVKASAEMKHRISSLIGEKTANGLILGTFHSIARRYLVKHGNLIGLKRDFGIADSADSLAILKRVVKGTGAGKADVSSIRNKISNMKARNDTEPTVHARARDGIEFWDAFTGYQENLRIQGLLDYDDLLLKCVELLKKHPEVVSKIRAVCVDEFQDTNLVQWDLLKLFSSQCRRVTVVGDPDQSIYGFRAAEIGNLKRMKQYFPETTTVILNENYRSAGSILFAAQEVIEQDISRPAKNLSPTHPYGCRPVLRKLPNATAEAQWIVSEIKRIRALTAKKVNLEDVAILVRSASLTRSIETQLGKAGLPYRMVGGHRFFDRVEVKIVLDYLRVVYSPANTDAVARILNVPARKIGEPTVKAMIEECEKRKKTLWDFMRQGVNGGFTNVKISKQAKGGISSFTSIIISARKLLETTGEDSPTVVDIISFISKKIQYRTYLTTKYPDDHEARWANVEEIAQQAAEFTAAQESGEYDPYDLEAEAMDNEASGSKTLHDSLGEFLANVALSSERTENDEEGPKDRLTISTIHAAKGLEWPIVFIPAAYEGSIPHSRSEDTDEERRLLYVAMTRAQALLYLSWPCNGSLREGGNSMKLSQFLLPSSVTNLMERKGPSFTKEMRRSMLQILGRLPVPSDIELAQAAAELETVEDDYWPIDPDADEEDEQSKPNKRRRTNSKRDQYGNEDDAVVRGTTVQRARGWDGPKTMIPESAKFTSGFVSASTTLSTVAGFSEMKTTMNSFQSASTHMKGLQARNIYSEADGERPRPHQKPFKPPTRVARQSSNTGSTLNASAMTHNPLQRKPVYPPSTSSYSSITTTSRSISTSSSTTTTSRSISISTTTSSFTRPSTALEPAPEKTAPAKKAPARKGPANQPSVLNFFKKAPAPPPLQPALLPPMPRGIIQERDGTKFIMLSSSPPRPEAKRPPPELAKKPSSESVLKPDSSRGNVMKPERKKGFLGDLLGKSGPVKVSGVKRSSG